MQGEVKASRKTKNFLIQAGLPVTQRNCSQYDLGQVLFTVSIFLWLPLSFGWPGKPRTSLSIYFLELLSIFVLPGLLWLTMRRKSPAFALCMKNNLILLAMGMPLLGLSRVLNKMMRHFPN